MLTQSESWFEEFCARAGIPVIRVPKDAGKTPDYLISVAGQAVVIEVKEITPNDDEKESDRVMANTGIGNVLSITPGDRVRKKIADASSQIKRRANGIHPSILVLCDLRHGCCQVSGHLDPYSIRVAMYGLEQIHMAVPKDRTEVPFPVGMSYGPKRKMTDDCNTSISAIGVLSAPEPGRVELDIFHNKHASVPLDTALLNGYDVRQYELEEVVAGDTSKWRRAE